MSPFAFTGIRSLGAAFAFLLSYATVSGQETQPALKISRLAGDLYVYTTYKELNGSPFPSNSMYLVTDIGVVLFDTPWDTTQNQPLLDTIMSRHKKKVILSISTHFHDDRTAGIEFLKRNGVRTYASKMTYDLCGQPNAGQPEYYFRPNTTFVVGGHKIETCYPGEGHTADNIVIWFEKEDVLYGGCLVKSTESKDLGNVADANLAEWTPTIQKVMRRFPHPRFVVPGHFGWSSDALQHTLELLRQQMKND